MSAAPSRAMLDALDEIDSGRNVVYLNAATVAACRRRQLLDARYRLTESGRLALGEHRAAAAAGYVPDQPLSGPQWRALAGADDQGRILGSASTVRQNLVRAGYAEWRKVTDRFGGHSVLFITVRGRAALARTVSST